ncbi:MAG: RimK/LysX family protein [Nanoarchaeota archaeon]|nr:RimK/LysX family protein [Nanoarchaeota archaeon]
MEKVIIGLTEKIEIEGMKIIAKIDTGANNNSICKTLAKELKLGPVIKNILIKAPNGSELRPVIKAKLKIHNKTMETTFNIADRSKMKYSVLIGQKVLKQGFLIDPTK